VASATYKTDIVAFAETFYTVDRAWIDGAVVRKHPIRLTVWQKAQLYDVFPVENGGRPVVRNYLDSEPKKLGKSTKAGIVAAYMAATEPNAEVYIAAADKDQAKDRVFKSIKYAVENGPLSDFARAYSDKIVFTNGSEIQALPMDWKGSSGGEPVCCVFDELHTYSYETERRLWDELVIPPTLPYGIRWVASYAGFTGESVLLREVWDKVQAGQVMQEWPTVYHNEDAGWYGMIVQDEQAYELVPWTQGKRGEQFLREAQESERALSYARLFKNRWVSSESAFVPAEWWEACLDPELKPLSPTKSIPLFVGVDAAVKANGDDAAAIALYRDKRERVCVAWYRKWTGGKARRQELRLDKTLEPYLERQANLYNIQSIRYDPRFMVNIANRLRDKGLPMVEVVQSLPVLGPLGQGLYSLVQDGKFAYYDDATLKNMAAGAMAKEVSSGLHIKKGTGKVDLLVACSFAANVAKAGSGMTIALVSWGSGTSPEYQVIIPDRERTELQEKYYSSKYHVG